MMTIEQRFEQLEWQNQRIERKNKRLTAALAVMAVAICAVVTMAATGQKVGRFDRVYTDTVVARSIFVKNDANPRGSEYVVSIGTTTDGDGTVRTFAPNGKELVELGASSGDTGGMVSVFNKTGEDVVQLYADEYGNGVVGAWNRKGKGRTLKPGP